MDREEEKYTRRVYSIPRDIYAPAKWFGMRLSSVLLVIVEPLIATQLLQRFFPPEKVLYFIFFILVNIIFMIWLAMPFNGKTNWYAVRLFFKSRKKSYKSIDIKKKPILDDAIDLSRR